MSRRNIDGVLDNVVAAVKRCVPTSSLPLSYKDHEDLACELVIELCSTVVLLDKQEFDRMTRQLQQLALYENAIVDGLLYSPLDGLQVLADPFLS